MRSTFLALPLWLALVSIVVSPFSDAAPINNATSASDGTSNYKIKRPYRSDKEMKALLERSRQLAADPTSKAPASLPRLDEDALAPYIEAALKEARPAPRPRRSVVLQHKNLLGERDNLDESEFILFRVDDGQTHLMQLLPYVDLTDSAAVKADIIDGQDPFVEEDGDSKQAATQPKTDPSANQLWLVALESKDGVRVMTLTREAVDRYRQYIRPYIDPELTALLRTDPMAALLPVYRTPKEPEFELHREDTGMMRLAEVCSGVKETFGVTHTTVSMGVGAYNIAESGYNSIGSKERKQLGADEAVNCMNIATKQLKSVADACNDLGKNVVDLEKVAKPHLEKVGDIHKKHA